METLCPNCLFPLYMDDKTVSIPCRCGCGTIYTLHQSNCALVLPSEKKWHGWGMEGFPNPPHIINSIVNPIGMSKQFCEA